MTDSVLSRQTDNIDEDFEKTFKLLMTRLSGANNDAYNKITQTALRRAMERMDHDVTIGEVLQMFLLSSVRLVHMRRYCAVACCPCAHSLGHAMVI